MIDSTSLNLITNLPRVQYIRRIKLYTRRLAEIERFIESNRGSLNIDAPNNSITIHKYWQL